MKKVFFSLLILLGMLSACSNDKDNLFVGKWQIVSFEDGDIIKDYPDKNNTIRFYADGRYAFTPYYVYVDGVVNEIHDSSESSYKMKYSFTEQELHICYDYDHRTDTYTYSFSDDYQTLWMTKTKRGHGTIDYITEPDDPMVGKTLLLKKISK